VVTERAIRNLWGSIFPVGQTLRPVRWYCRKEHTSTKLEYPEQFNRDLIGFIDFFEHHSEVPSQGKLQLP
jgi:hypothetical protein